MRPPASPSLSPSATATASSAAPASDTAPHRGFRLNFTAQILLGLAVGVALGFLALAIGTVPGAGEGGKTGPNWLTLTMQTVGSAFVGLLKVTVPPIVFLAVVTSIAQLRGVTNAAALAWRTLVWFAITSLIAVLIGETLGILFQPGAVEGLAAKAKAPSTVGTWFDFLKGLIPGNFLGEKASFKDGTVSLSFDTLQILVMSIAVGIAALKVGAKAEPFLRFADSALEIVQKVLWWIIRLAPIGTAALIGNAVVSYGWSTIGALGTFVVLVAVGTLIVGFVVYPILLKVHGLSVRRFFSGVWPATALGFATRASLGTMPVTRAVTIQNLGVPRAYASFAVPLGSVSKMDGCAAIYPAIAAIFVANFYHVDLSPIHYLLIALVSVLGSAATAGVTGATVMLTLTLSTLGLPLEGVGLLLGVDAIVDMFRTALNVTGQALVPVIVSKHQGILDLDVYNGADTFEGLGDEGAVPAERDVPAGHPTPGVTPAHDAPTEFEGQPATADAGQPQPSSAVHAAR